MNHLWDEIPGQIKVKAFLTKICESRRVPHAFLFCGNDGVGKYFTAIQFAKIINQKSDKTNSDFINSKIYSLQEPYLKLIIPLPRGKGETGDDNATEKLSKEVLLAIADEIQKKTANPYHKIFIEDANNIKINSIREITKFVNTAIEELEYRFVVIEDAHLMNDQAQNALLKNLEEPPEGIIFILITSDKDKLLPTIKSRCWQVEFEPLSFEIINKILIQHFSIDKVTAEKISSFSEGSVTSALSLLDSDLDYLLEKTISFLRYSLGKKYNLAYRELNVILKHSSNGSIKMITRLIKKWLSDIERNKHSFSKYYFEDYKETLEKFNERFNKTIIYSIFNSINKIEEHEDKNINLNVACLNLIFEISSISIRK
jgi:DNA polymerase III subunit delta'